MVEFFGHYYFWSDFREIFIILIIIGMGIWYIFIANDSKQRRNFRTQKFFQTLSLWYKDGLIENSTDISNIFAGIIWKDDDNDRLCSYLKSFLSAIINGWTDIGKWEKMKVKKEISKIIENYEKENPFSELPSQERNILKELEIFLKEENNDGIERKINELKNVILTRQINFQKMEKMSKWSTPLGIVGIVIWLIGLIPIFFLNNSKENTKIDTHIMNSTLTNSGETKIIK